MRVSADTREGRAALAALRQSLREVGAGSGTTLDPFTASVARATGGIRDLKTSLRPLQSALAGVAAAVSVGRLVSMADEYGQMASRIKMATSSTAEYEEVQRRLLNTANQTYRPLSEAQELFIRSADALRSMGYSTEAALDVTDSFSYLLVTNAASADRAAAAVSAYSKAIQTGKVDADGWQSILAAMPTVVDAIAAATGRSAAEVRKLGVEGKLSARELSEGFRQSLEASRDAAAAMPTTVGDAFVKLNNSIAAYLGEANRATGATQVVADAIGVVAQNIDTLVRVGVPLLVAALVPMIYRLGLTAAAATRAAIALAVFNPAGIAIGVAAAAGAYYALNKALEEVAENQGKLNAEEQAAEAKRNAEDRKKVAEDLAAALARLEKLRAVEAGKANAEILLDEQELAKKRIDEARKAIEAQVKGYESLGGTLNKVWGDAIEKARSLRAEAAKLQQDAAAARTTGADKAQDRRMRGWTDEEKDSYARRQARDLRDQASRSATYAQNAALRGDLERAAQLAAEAAKYAERAEKYGDMIQDDDVAANLFEELGRIREDALKAQSQIKQAEAKAQEDLAAAVTEQITQNEERLKALRAELEKPATLQADITQAEAQIKQLQAQLDALKDKTITVTVNTVSTAPADTRGMSREELIEAIPGRAYGGPLPGTARGDRSDNVIYRGTPGEWVIQRPAVRYWGANFLRAINEMRMPRFAYGGEIGAEQRAPLAAAGSSESRTPVVLQWPDGSRSPLSARDDVADEIVRVFQRAALQRGRR